MNHPSGRAVALTGIAGCVGGLLAACGGDPPAVSSSAGTADDDRVAQAAARTYACQGTPVPADILTAARPPDELPADVQAALAEAEAAEDGLWTVAGRQPEMILLRELAEPDGRSRPPSTHAMLHLRPSVDGTMEEPAPGEPWQWRISGATHCALRLSGGIAEASGLVWADLALDPATPPDPSSRVVTVLARFPECVAEGDVAGPWHVPHLAEGSDVIEVVVGAEPAPPPAGPVPAVCDGSDAVVPVVLELDAPLGERVLVDPTVLPERPLG